ncbi:hypothetical protein [Streptomyces sp. NPDC048172]|uniref:hypothetical protein n=1 Tax=Streptomyces sp. NPDC048172 TaxID=3365505 RepID=UPI0037216ECD
MGGAFVEQLPALTGVVIGALGSYLAVMRGDRARFRREQAARWEERRLTAYSDFARSLKVSVSVMFRAAAHLGNDANPHPLPPDEAAPRLSDAAESRDLAWEALLLLGAPEVVETARGWAGTVAGMERFVRDGTRDPAAWTALLAEQRAARERYYTAARHDVALAPGHPGRWGRGRGRGRGGRD